MISSERLNVILKSAISGIFAGFFIALGGISYIFCLAYISDQGLAKVLGSLIFTVGLFFVCVLGVFLYTGRIGYVFEKDDYKFTKLITMLLFNLLAAYLFGLVCYFIFQNDTNLINSVNNLTLNKINFLTDYYLPLKLMAKGFLCGALVFIATYIYKFSKTAVFKLADTTLGAIKIPCKIDFVIPKVGPTSFPSPGTVNLSATRSIRFFFPTT